MVRRSGWVGSGFAIDFNYIGFPRAFSVLFCKAPVSLQGSARSEKKTVAAVDSELPDSLSRGQKSAPDDP